MRNIATTTLFWLSISLFGTTVSTWAQSGTSYVPDADNFEKWAKFIRPNEEERSFERVGWRNEFWPAVEEAKKLGRPILLWTMNGHPLGCT